MFADTDFILAAIKPSDWLKQNAKKILMRESGNIRTSISVMIEVALVCKRSGISIFDAYANIFEIISMEDQTRKICSTAAVYIEKHNVNVFDAFHAAYCDNDRIISSDSIYEKIGIERVKLEKA